MTNRYLSSGAIDELFARIDANLDEDWYLTDRFGSVRQIADTDGTITNIGLPDEPVAYVSFGYDADSRLTSIQRKDSQTSTQPGTCTPTSSPPATARRRGPSGT